MIVILSFILVDSVDDLQNSLFFGKMDLRWSSTSSAAASFFCPIQNFHILPVTAAETGAATRINQIVVYLLYCWQQHIFLMASFSNFSTSIFFYKYGSGVEVSGVRQQYPMPWKVLKCGKSFSLQDIDERSSKIESFMFSLPSNVLMLVF